MGKSQGKHGLQQWSTKQPIVPLPQRLPKKLPKNEFWPCSKPSLN